MDALDEGWVVGVWGEEVECWLSALDVLASDLLYPAWGHRSTGSGSEGAPPGPLLGGGGDREGSERALMLTKLVEDPQGALIEKPTS